MEVALIILSLLLCFAGIWGCIIPSLPGPPLNFIAMLFMQWAVDPFRLRTLVIWAGITILVVALDYLIPLWTAKKFGATRQGIYGSLIGMFIGMFVTPIGMIAGLLIGSVIGDLLARSTLKQAAISATGNLFGTFISVGLKLICAGWMTLLVVYETLSYLIS